MITPDEDRMRITVVERCETNLRVPKLYNVSVRNRKIIDDVFDNLQDWANMSWFANATPPRSLGHGGQYQLPLQEDLIAKL